MKKLFVSLPMNGKDDVEIRRSMLDRHKVAELIAGEDLELIPSLLTGKEFDDLSPLEMLSISLNLMAKADYVYFVDGWQNARGCSIEHTCAKEYGLNILKD